MFKQSTASRFPTILRRNDRGIALPMVLIVFLVGFALVTAFLVAIVGSAQVSNTTRSGIQAQAAAEAGIAAALAEIGASDPCAFNGTSSTTTPRFSVTVEKTSCAAATNARITLWSVGRASDETTRKVEAVYAVSPASAGNTGAIAETSLFIVQGSGGSLAALNVTSSATTPPPVIITMGSFKCGGNNFSIPGDLIVVSGGADLGSGNCQVLGNIYAKGNVVTGYGNTIGGNIYSNGTVTVQSSLGTSAAPKSVFASGNVELHWDSTLQNISSGGNVVVNGTAKGDVRAAGTISGGGVVKGARAAGVTSPAVVVPSETEVPQWVDYGFNASDWTGFTVKTWTAADCTSFAEGSAKWTSFGATYPTNTVIDARNCSDGLVTSWGNPTVTLKSDIAFIVNKATIRNSMTIKSGDGKAHSVAFITPDANQTLAGPQCPTGGGSIIFANTQITAPISVNVYTPCGVTMQSASLRGGLFVNGLRMEWGNSYLAAEKITLPGAKFGTGSVSGGTTTPATTRKLTNSSAPLTIRDISS